MQAIMEGLFDAFYLSTVIILGLTMIKKGKDNSYFKLFGFMSVILGSGDAFHLVPRIYALFTSGLEANAAALGFGKLITSISMTIFYVIIYEAWKIRFAVKDVQALNLSVYSLALIRILLCFFPQNQWFSYYAPVSWGVYRNIPFAMLGILIIYLCYSKARLNKDKAYMHMAVAIFLSFSFYIPVVLWATTYRIIGMLMIPKTLAYLWIVYIGYKQFKTEYQGKIHAAYKEAAITK
jgi:hypothetical protein